MDKFKYQLKSMDASPNGIELQDQFLHKDILQSLNAYDLMLIFDHVIGISIGAHQITISANAALTQCAQLLIQTVHCRLERGLFSAFIEFPHKQQLFSGNDARNVPTYNNIQVLGIFRKPDGTTIGQKKTSTVLIDGGTWVLTRTGSIYVLSY